jgi:hypothetical protein
VFVPLGSTLSVPKGTKEAKVEIVLSVDAENIGSFLEEWSQTVQHLITFAGVDSAKITLPASTIELSRW